MHWIWSEWFWLLPGLTWEDFKSRDGIQIPEMSDLLYWPLVAMIVLLILRKAVVIPLVFVPLGKYMGVRSKPVSPPPSNLELEKLYKVNRAKPPPDLLERYATETKMTERQVERWLRRKASSEQKTNLEKFTDYGWELTYYTCFCIFGLLVVATEPWCYDIEKVTEDYPRIPISQGIFWYMIVAFGFYLGQTYLLLTQPKKFDFNLMLLHHICTLCLMILNWVVNLVRFGALTLLVHECVDIFLALGKLASYCGMSRVSDLMSIPFCLVWFPTRVVIFPFHVVRGTVFVVPTLRGGVCPAYFFLNSFMVLLVIMHLFWSYKIIKAMIVKLKRGTSFNENHSHDEISSDDHPHKNETLLQNETLFQNKKAVQNGTLPQNGNLLRGEKAKVS